jgi:hypothetical protein
LVRGSFTRPMCGSLLLRMVLPPGVSAIGLVALCAGTFCWVLTNSECSFS